MNRVVRKNSMKRTGGVRKIMNKRMSKLGGKRRYKKKSSKRRSRRGRRRSRRRTKRSRKYRGGESNNEDTGSVDFNIFGKFNPSNVEVGIKKKGANKVGTGKTQGNSNQNPSIGANEVDPNQSQLDSNDTSGDTSGSTLDGSFGFTPSFESTESTPSLESTESTPSLESTESTPSFESTESTPSFESTESTPDGSVGSKLDSETSMIQKLQASDKRLKSNIKRLGNTTSGIPTYTWNYKSGLGYDTRDTYYGTMAQDLLRMGREDAVVINDSNYYMVDYSKLDIINPGLI